MKIAVAQIQPVKADIGQNLVEHRRLIELAAAHQVELIVFPELSLTGYEPTLASQVATAPTDSRFFSLQTLADDHQISICAGVPIITQQGICISMLIFRPNQPVQVYSKQYLHSDEVPFFVPGQSQALAPLGQPDSKIAFAICYELSVPEHAEAAHASGASIYIASVAKTPAGVAKAAERLATVAQQYGMTVFMANCIGECDQTLAGGGSAIWNAEGTLLASLSDQAPGLIAYNPAQPDLPAEVIRWMPSVDIQSLT
jgi:predicted amidohydrolase